MNLFDFLKVYQHYLGGSIKGNDKAKMIMECNGDKVQFPIVPAELPAIEHVNKNDVFESVVGDMSTIGLVGLRTMDFNDLLVPSQVNRYNFASGDNGNTIANFLQDGSKSMTPFRIVITVGYVTYINMLCLVDTYSFNIDNVGMYHFNMSITEYTGRGSNIVAIN